MFATPSDKVTPTVTLVLLPGLDGTEVFFEPLLAALPPWVRPVVVTYPTSGANGYSDLLPIAEAAVASLDDFYVLGWSFSGPLALMLAAKEPSRTRGVILCASFVRSPRPVLSWLRFAVVPPVVGLVRVARRTPGVLLGTWSPELRRAKRGTWARVSSRVLAARARAILAVDARQYLRNCQRPVLYLAGSRDTVVHSRNAAEIARESSTTRIVTIDGPHLAMYTNPHAAAQAILRFMGASHNGRPFCRR
jgi:pimeloyl-ACP methyl ester carboxylesterase